MSTHANGDNSQSASISSFPLSRAPIPDSYISRPVRFADGPYAGKRILVRLAELQKADVGRKCGLRDRRPLDPPPVVRLRLYEVRDPGAQIFREEEITNLAEVDSHGWMCHVDLFPVPLSAGSPPSFLYPENTPIQGVPDHPMEPYRHSQYTFPPPPAPEAVTRDRIFPASSSTGTDGSTRYGHESTLSTGVTSPALYGSAGSPNPVVTYYNGIPILESSACTVFIVGTTIASSTMLNYQGANQILFTFSDIAVREDGDYFLRYRVFNALYHVLGDTPIPILAEHFGGPFKVYSTKDFPGLQASTDLTKHMLLSGVRVNAREHERKRRRSLHSGWSHEEMQPDPFVPTSPQAGTSAGTVAVPMAGADPPHYYADGYYSWPGRWSENYTEWRRDRGGSF